MKIVIFGSTGGTGQQLVNQALALGYEVSAFARNSQMITQKHKQLMVIQGDVLNEDDVNHAVKGHDAVICALGLPSIMDNSRLREKGTKNICSAMLAQGVKRLICQSSLGTAESYKLLPLAYKYFIAPLFMQRLFKDHLAQEMLIKKSSSDWTIARPGVLTNGELSEVYVHGVALDGVKLKAKISRADVANFMLQQLNKSDYLKQAAYVSY